MVKVIRLIEKFGKDLAAEKHWIAAEYNYLLDMRNLLQEAARQLVNRSPLSPINEALRDLRQVGRSERRVSRYEKRRKKDLKELMRILPLDEQDFYNRVEQQIDVAKAHLTKGASLFIGDLRERTESLKLDLSVLEKLMKEKTPDINRISNYRGIVHKAILSLDRHIAEMIKWIGALSVDIIKEEQEEERLKKMAA